MRVLAITNMYPELDDPSSGTFVEQQVEGLRDIGVGVEVLYIKRKKEGMRVYLRIAKDLTDSINRTQPDLVHVMYGGVMADRVTMLVQDRPTIVTFHGSDLLGEHLSGVARKIIAYCGVQSSWRAARRADRVITVSKQLCDSLPRDIDRSKVHIIPNGIDLRRFQPLDRLKCRKQLQWDDETFHIVFPANSGDPVKRPELAEAAVKVLQDLKVPVEMHYLRGVKNEEVPIWLNASDALLLTSRHEGSPTIVKEALACDLPVVSVDVGDVRDRIKGIDGCYIASSQPHDLAAKLLSVHGTVGRVKSREKMKEFSLEQISYQLKTLYTGTLHKRIAIA